MSIRFLSKPILTAVIIILLALAAIPAVYFYNKYQISQRQLQNPNEYAKEEQRLLMEKVGKLIELPVGEQPTIATVTDADKLRTQPFFANSQNGDRVLIFTGAKKAFLYRPSTNKIIEVAPVNLGNQATPSAELSPLSSPGPTSSFPISTPTKSQTPTPSVRPVSPTPTP